MLKFNGDDKLKKKNFTIIEYIYIYYKVSMNSEFVHVLERNTWTETCFGRKIKKIKKIKL